MFSHDPLLSQAALAMYMHIPKLLHHSVACVYFFFLCSLKTVQVITGTTGHMLENSHDDAGKYIQLVHNAVCILCDWGMLPRARRGKENINNDNIFTLESCLYLFRCDIV